jgi:hypothetical protein
MHRDWLCEAGPVSGSTPCVVVTETAVRHPATSLGASRLWLFVETRAKALNYRSIIVRLSRQKSVVIQYSKFGVAQRARVVCLALGIRP